MGGGGSDTNNAPWSVQAQYLADVYRQAQQQSEIPLSYYPGSTVAGRAPTSVEGEAAALDMIRSGSPGVRMSGSYIEDALSGSFLDAEANKYLRPYAQMGADDITRNYMTATAPQALMGSSSRGGSGVEANQISQNELNLGDTLQGWYDRVYMGNYDRERGLMDSAMRSAPAVGAAYRGDITTGYGLGAGAEDYEQRLIGDLMARYEYGREEPYQRLSRYQGFVQPGFGAYGQSQTSSDPGAAPYAGAAAAVLSAIIGAAASSCSAALKDEIDAVDCDAVLGQVEQLPLKIWKYKPEVETPTHEPHLGPYAEDFQRLFGIGNGREIFLMDGIGIALAAVKSLLGRVKELEQRMEPVQPAATPKLSYEVSR